MVKEDCFAFKTFRNGIKTCAVLKELLCKQKECPFYKTTEEYEKGFANLNFKDIKVKKK